MQHEEAAWRHLNRLLAQFVRLCNRNIRRDRQPRVSPADSSSTGDASTADDEVANRKCDDAKAYTSPSQQFHFLSWVDWMLSSGEGRSVALRNVLDHANKFLPRSKLLALQQRYAEFIGSVTEPLGNQLRLVVALTERVLRFPYPASLDHAQALSGCDNLSREPWRC